MLHTSVTSDKFRAILSHGQVNAIPTPTYTYARVLKYLY